MDQDSITKTTYGYEVGNRLISLEWCLFFHFNIKKSWSICGVYDKNFEKDSSLWKLKIQLSGSQIDY